MFDIWWLLQPSSLMAIALLLAMMGLAGRSYRFAGIFAAVALLIVAVPTTFDLAGRLTWELERRADRPAELPEEVDGILVLGGAVEWRISREREQLNLNGAGERMLAAAALARRYPDARLALTGVYRDDVENEFVGRPRDSSLIFGEEYLGRRLEFIGESRSTYEDALLALERLDPRSGETWLLVTSAMHMPRAKATFRNLGWSLTPYPVDFRTAGEPPLINPHPDPARSLAALDEAVREWGAVLVYARMGRIDQP